MLMDENYHRWAVHVAGGLYSLTGSIGWSDYVESDTPHGSRCPDDFYIEEMIEEGVSALARQKLPQARCIRIHYGASKGFHVADSVMAKVKYLKISRSTYYAYLEAAREFVQDFVDSRMVARDQMRERVRDGRINA